MTDRIIIDKRFNGPPTSGNGGYVAGRLGSLIPGASEVTLRKPPPLDTAMTLRGGDAGLVELWHGEELIAAAAPVEFELDVPAPPSLEAAADAETRYRGHHAHPFVTCFVCGPAREHGDGLRLFTGEVDGRDIVAARWTPGEAFTGDDGAVGPEYVWAAMDCPGYYAVSEPGEVAVLGRLTAQINAVPSAQTQCIIIGWSLGRDGRKLRAGTALYRADGVLLASAKAVWIKLEQAP